MPADGQGEVACSAEQVGAGGGSARARCSRQAGGQRAGEVQQTGGVGWQGGGGQASMVLPYQSFALVTPGRVKK
jgi:hypothetical protein